MTDEKYRYGSTRAGLPPGRTVELLPDLQAIGSLSAGRFALSRRVMFLSTVAVFTGCLNQSYANDSRDIGIVVVDGWVLSRADLTPGVEPGPALPPLSAT